MVLPATACIDSGVTPHGQLKESAQQQASEFLMDSSTFKFDGVQESIELNDTITLEIPDSWTFIYGFESTHAGYGNREDQMLTQVITPHTAYITVQQGNIAVAQLDNIWDMLRQRELRQQGYPDGLEVIREADIQGTITEIAYVGNVLMDGTLLVELEELNATSDKFYISVPTGTLLYSFDDNESERIKFRDFQIGQVVDVWFDGPVAESYPAQAKAKQILLNK